MAERIAIKASESLPGLAEAASKYLYFMAFVRSASADTLRSYRSDLIQAFGFDVNLLPGLGDLSGAAPSVSGRPPGRSGGPPPRLDETPLLDACREALNRWSSLAPATRNRKAATLKSFLNWLHEESAVERELAVLIHAPKVPQRLPHHLSVDEAMALLESTRTDLENAPTEAARKEAARDLALLLLLYGGGLRVSEASSLKWSQIEGSGKLLRIRGKGGAERMVALPPLATRALEALKETSRDEFVFGATALSTRRAYEIVRTRGARAGLLKPLHPHALRHSFATHLLSSGANLRTLQELLGHRTLQATQRYTHLGLDQLARTLEKCHPLSAEPAPQGTKRLKRGSS